MKKKTAPATKRDGRLFVGDHAAMFVPYGSAFFIQADIPSDDGVAVQTPAPEFVVSAIARAVKDGEHAYHLGQINNDTLTDLRGQQLAFQRQQSLDGKETIGAVQSPEEAE